jgi:hypothetical protein
MSSEHIQVLEPSHKKCFFIPSYILLLQSTMEGELEKLHSKVGFHAQNEVYFVCWMQTIL